MRAHSAIVAFAGIFLLAASQVAVAQDTTETDAPDTPEITSTPDLSGPSLQDVLAACAVEIAAELCVATTREYLDSLDARNLADGDYSQALADLVFGLGGLAQQGSGDAEHALALITAIGLAEAAANQRGLATQAEQFAGIAATIEQGYDFETAEIAEEASPA